MSFIHPETLPCVSSDMELFNLPQTQLAVSENRTVEYRPLATITDGSQIDFNIPAISDEYINLNEILLCVSAKIVKSAGDAVLTDVESAKVAPAQYFLHSLFNQCDITLNNRLVSGGLSSYMYSAYLEALLSYDSGAKNTHLKSALWIEDPDEDENFKKRSAFSKGSKVIQLIGRLHADICKQNRLVVSGVDIKIKLQRSKDSFCIDTKDDFNTKLKVKILECSLLVQRVKPTPAVFNAHMRMLQNTNARYPYRKTITKVVSVNTGNRSVNVDNLIHGQIPIRIILGFVHHEAFNGHHHRPGYKFEPFKLNHLTLRVNGQSFPSKPLTPDFGNNAYTHAYFSLFQGIGGAFQNYGNCITLETFGKNTTLYAFDLTPDGSASNSSHVNLVRQGVVALEAQFASVLEHNINLICYFEHQGLFEITHARDILMETI